MNFGRENATICAMTAQDPRIQTVVSVLTTRQKLMKPGHVVYVIQIGLEKTAKSIRMCSTSVLENVTPSVLEDALDLLLGTECDVSKTLILINWEHVYAIINT